ncbi:MAG TPA: 16S rRNA (uracil(1498)-N(3))-methyltransferase [Kiritimatiellia bacterium]|nr:16S rRNA (uracil(1498)-N(3))-methyltransferase [Kiritimatiellia bacterium]HRZ12138.1 16S rRNA (uracil(1498)-N(3))-methyltransferase [Kiritimatiellia bacterium]HSA18104.1 16S rRNA (uracil(1498)-N(3))-methyltransferase [Kiritimatiellia bacterium]
MSEPGKTHARAFLPGAAWERGETELPADEGHHLARVLRVRAGDRVEIFNGRGGEGAAEVLEVVKDRVRLRVLSRAQKPEPRPAVTLALAVLRETPMNWAVQKAVELGAAAIAPVWTARGVVRPSGKENRCRRWEAIVLNAARQCRAAWLPSVEAPVELPAFLARPREGLFIVAALEPGAVPLCRALAAAPAPERVTALVGPEGDFTPDELREARAAGAVAVTLGARTLRAETAALYLLSALQHQWGTDG